MPEGALLATMEQVPAPTSVTVTPLTVHTPVVDEAKLTVEPDVAVAERAKGASPKVLFAKALKEMVCGAPPDTTTGVPLLLVAPFPNCPRPPSPQQLTEPSERMAQAKLLPALTATACVMPEIETGAMM